VITVHRGTQGYTGVHRGTQGYTGVHRDTHGYTGVHRGTQGYTWIHRGTQGYTAHELYIHQGAEASIPTLLCSGAHRQSLVLFNCQSGILCSPWSNSFYESLGEGGGGLRAAISSIQGQG